MNIRSELSYIQPIKGPAFYYIHQTPKGEAPSNVEGDRRVAPIEDARAFNPPPSLDREGAQLIPFDGTPPNENDPDSIERDFYPKVEELVREKFGAFRVHAFDHNLRSSDKDATVDTEIQSPVWLVHNDYTESSAPQRVRDLLPEEAESLMTKRFAVINFWKPLYAPVHEAPLAICDAQTLRKEDCIETELRYPDRTGEIYSFSYSERHRWFYFPEMTPDEALLIKCFDSAEGPSGFTAHTAVRDPNTRPGARPRQSIEVRTLAFLD
jgi:hypothetical protein